MAVTATTGSAKVAEASASRPRGPLTTIAITAVSGSGRATIVPVISTASCGSGGRPRVRSMLRRVGAWAGQGARREIEDEPLLQQGLRLARQLVEGRIGRTEQRGGEVEALRAQGMRHAARQADRRGGLREAGQQGVRRAHHTLR